MNKDRVGIEVAELAKKLGYKERSPYYYIIGFGRLERATNLHKFPFQDNENENVFQNITVGEGRPHLAVAPTQSELQTWLRERGVDVFVDTYWIAPGLDIEELKKSPNGKRKFNVSIICKNINFKTTEHNHLSWEEALEAGLKLGLEYYLEVVARNVFNTIGEYE